jgi:hypothetical protein
MDVGFRRMREYESDRHWCDALLDATVSLCRLSAFFSIRGENLYLQGIRGKDSGTTAAPPEIAVRNAPAFRDVLAKGEPVFVTRSQQDLSAVVAGLFGEANDSRVALIPVAAGDRIPGVLYIEDPVDIPALQMIAGAAGSALDGHLLREEGLIRTGARVRPVVEQAELTVCPNRDRSRPALPDHGGARRFASVAVARMVLDRFAELRRGRDKHDLYSELQPDMDAAREMYAKQHGHAPDYLHEEFVRTLANGREDLLGPNYPGPLA